MGRHKKKLTPEQIEWRESILRRKVDVIKKAETKPNSILSDEDKIKSCFYYLNNSIHWINEYVDGNIDNERLLETAKSIEYNAQKLKSILVKIPHPLNP